MGLPLFPPSDFDRVIELYIKNANFVNMSLLAYFDFRDAPMPVWGGEFDLSSGGTTWKGLGNICSVEGLEDAANLESSDMTFVVSGVDATVLSVFKDEDRADTAGRLVGVYMQFCDADFKPVCSPYAIRAGIMGDPTASIDKRSDGNGGETIVRSITLPASNLFYGRGTSRASFNTDRDQQLRHPGDRFMEFIAGLQESSIIVPWH